METYSSSQENGHKLTTCDEYKCMAELKPRWRDF